MLDNKVFTLLKIYECGSFSEAANQLPVTQPAVSQHVKALEKELGVPLFDRTGGRLTLTQEGKAVIDCALRMTELEERLRRELAGESSPKKQLSVGVTRSSGSGPAVRALAAFREKNAEVRLRIVTDDIKNLYRMLKNHELDLALAEGWTTDRDLSFMPLGTNRLALAVAPGHRLAGSGAVSIEELKKEKIILRLPDPGAEDLFASFLARRGIGISDLDAVIGLDSDEAVMALVRRGFGVAVLPVSVCLDEIKEGSLAVVPVEGLAASVETNLVFRRDFTPTETLSDVADAYSEVINAYKQR